MASGTSSGSSQLLNPHSEEDLNSLKKLKRKISNRESARRSRMRKQRQLGELTGEVSRLRREKSQLTSSLGVAKQLYAALEAENSVLRAQVMELSYRLQALAGILDYVGDRCNMLYH
ncbi:bZIP transcription factor 44-like [Curcuma longa]|uniref:bZIP transcription factor 44-like n=1 Tax=Curcuma longa TaxID=136217 RepID=UPI003D9F9605